MPTDDSYREKLDARAENLNRWLMGAAVLFTLLAVLTALVLAKGVALDMATSELINRELDRIQDRFRELDLGLVDGERLLESLEAVERLAEATALDGIGDILESTGEQVVVESGTLQNSEAATVNVELEEGWDYTFIGICDDDCIDLDLVLRLDDTEVEIDDLLDALPIINYSPNASGEFKLDVRMVECAIERCSWQLEGFRRETVD